MSKTLIIDAGHGGTDSGAVGINALEKDWNLKMSLYQHKRMKELGAKVALTRESDLTLDPTQRIARIKNQYDVCTSNHFNAFNGTARGVETIHSIHAKPNFATDLARQIVSVSGLPMRRVFTREMKKGTDYYFMHRMTGKTETVIIEYGFIDQKDDFEYYNNDHNFYKIAEAVVEILCRKVGITYQPPKNTTNNIENCPDCSSIHKCLNCIANEGTSTSSKESSGNSSGSKNTNGSARKAAYIGKRVESIHNGQLRFYNKPSWQDKDVYGYLTKGIGFNPILDKVTVGNGQQYKVKNSKGEIYYVTASPTFVRVV